MPIFPTYTSQVNANSGRSNAPTLPGPIREAYGENIGRALQQSGQNIQQGGQALADADMRERERLYKEKLANDVAGADFSKEEFALRNAAPVDGVGLQERTVERYRDWVDEYADTIDDDKRRTEVRTRLLADLPNVSARAAQFEFTQQAANSKLDADASLNGIQSRVQNDPMYYQRGLELSNDVIDSRPGLNAQTKAGMKQANGYDLAKRRFEGRISAVTSVDDLDAVEDEIKDSTWDQKLLPEDRKSLLSTTQTLRNVFLNKNEANALAGLGYLESRNDNLEPIPPEELAEVGKMVKGSDKMSTQMKMARINRDQKIITLESKLPPKELKARIDAGSTANEAFKNLPPPLAKDIQDATAVFDVPASALASTVFREAGNKLQVPYGYRKDGAPKGKGFFGELKMADGSIATELSIGVNIDGKETEIPTLVPTLTEEEKQYLLAGGQPTETIVQKAATSAQERIKAGQSPFADTPEINYDFPTDVKDEAGNPATTARGVMQFLDATFLETMKTSGVAETMGVDITFMTDEEILKLRGDKRISVMAGAAYMAKNKNILQNSLQRDVTDAELYMAHFMGPEGALAFIANRDHNPSGVAADYMPQAAKNNPGVFYADGKKLTLDQVYTNISSSIMASTDIVQFGDNQLRQKMYDKMVKSIQEDVVGFSDKTGTFVATSLDEEGYAKRGQQILAMADYYSMPVESLKPFRPDEEQTIRAVLEGEEVAPIMDTMAQIASMPPKAAKAALNQLGQKDKSFALAGQIFMDGGADGKSVASDIIRGRIKIKQDPSMLKNSSVDETAIDRYMRDYTHTALVETPELRAAVAEAATAVWVETEGTKGKKMNAVGTKGFYTAIDRVLGGNGKRKAIDYVNGVKTYIPDGIDAKTMQRGVESMTMADWIRMSASKSAPKLVDGYVPDEEDLRDEAKFRYAGGGSYLVMMSDGSYLTADGDKYFEFIPDVGYLTTLAQKRADAGDFKNPGFYGP